MSNARVTVIGAGVVGLSVARELAEAGHRVTVAADADAARSVSGVAGGIWFPHLIERSPQTSRIEERSLTRMEELADRPETGVELLEGLYLERGEDPDRSWTAVLHSPCREASADELPDGVRSGLWARLPMVTMPRYLAWLREECDASGVRFERRTVSRLDELVGATDLVVVAAGMRSGPLVGDDSLYPVRGQIVRVANPGLTTWLIDDHSAGGDSYILPRGDGVIVGGTGDVGAWAAAIDPAEESAMLARAEALVPELAGQPVLGRAVGLRPVRDGLRIERVDGMPLPVVACYGHGGAGVTLSWGSAERVAELVAEATA